MKFEVTQWLDKSYTIVLICQYGSMYINHPANLYNSNNIELLNYKDIVSCIGKYVDITIDEYIKILNKYNAYQYCRVYYFKNKNDAEKAVEELHEKYILILNLMGVE